MIDFRISRLMQKCAAFFKSPRFAMLMVAMIATGVAIAQTSDINVTAGTGALESVAQGIAKYVPFITKLCYAIAGVVAIVGAISVYVAMNNEEQDVKNILVLQNRQETRRKEMKLNSLLHNTLCRYFNFSIFENVVLKNI